MADEELQIIRLKYDFYRDGFNKILFSLSVLIIAIVLLIATSIYLVMAKPKPVSFVTDDDWRVLAPVPVDNPYLTTPNLLQWVSTTMATVFNFDFLNYANRLKDYEQYFSEAGWKKYNDILNMYVPANSIQASKAVVTGTANGAPFVVNQGLLSGRYAWWVQMPVHLTFSGVNKGYSQDITLQILVARVPTLNNLSGVVIDNIVIVNR